MKIMSGMLLISARSLKTTTVRAALCLVSVQAYVLANAAPSKQYEWLFRVINEIVQGSGCLIFARALCNISPRYFFFFFFQSRLSYIAKRLYSLPHSR